MTELVNKEKENYAAKNKQRRFFDKTKRTEWKAKSRHIS